MDSFAGGAIIKKEAELLSYSPIRTLARCCVRAGYAAGSVLLRVLFCAYSMPYLRVING